MYTVRQQQPDRHESSLSFQRAATENPGTDAVFQEMATLAGAFDGEIVHLHPFANPAQRFPMAAMGLTRLPQILKLAASCDVVHVFNPTLYAFPFLRFVSKPVVYTVSASLRRKVSHGHTRFAKRLSAIVVSNTRDHQNLSQRGLINVFKVMPGHDLSKFAKLRNRPARQSPKGTNQRLRLLSASAPWTLSQFKTKGIDALLEAVSISNRLEATLVMRGSYQEVTRRKVEALGISGRVTILDGTQDIAAVMAGSDCAVLAASTPEVVKAWPHSLLEALAARRPVITSRKIPIADFVAETGCGIVLETVSGEAIAQAAEAIAGDLTGYRAAARRFRWQEFSPQAMAESYEAIYRAAIRKKTR